MKWWRSRASELRRLPRNTHSRALIQSTLRCTGGHDRDCNCTDFQRMKTSMRCHCSHDFDHRRLSSDSDDVKDGNSDDSRFGKPPAYTGNKRIVSLLVSNLIRDGEYTRGEFEHAQNEMRAGFTKRHVSQLAKCRKIQSFMLQPSTK